MLSPDERARLLESGVPYALRLDMAAACARAGDLGWIEHGEGPDGETGAVAARPQAWGDVILARKETPTSYHLSVVIDDALQGVTEVVRGQDLFWSTSVHRLLQQLLGLPQPAYRHHRLVRDGDGAQTVEIDRGHGLAGTARRRRDAGRYPPPGRPALSRGGRCPQQRVRRDSPRPAMAWWRRARVGGIMAPKSRSQRIDAAAEKAAAEETRPVPRASARHAAAAAPGMVEAALAAFAHEVRTPLTGILAISDLLATSDLGERERRWVDTIKAGAEHLASLATLFVDAARSGNAGPGVRQDLFDLRALARNAGDSLAGRAAAKGLQSPVDISEKLPAFVVGDPVRLRAALENLIDNAVKFTEKRRRRAQGRADARGARQGRRRVCGFRQRHRADAEGNQAAVPSVLAGQCQHRLALRRRRARPVVGQALARAMGGDIVVAQRRGGGTTFTLTVMLTRAKAAKAADSDADAEPPPDPVRPLRVLSVEDNPFGRVVLNAILTELGHQAEFIGRGEAAAERIADGAFDAVLMDMVLPGINGIEAIRRIRELKPPHGRIAIIGVSGRGDDEAASRAAGADAFLVKPVSPRALATALLEATRRAAAAT